jgi:hypothetical protein
MSWANLAKSAALDPKAFEYVQKYSTPTTPQYDPYLARGVLFSKQEQQATAMSDWQAKPVSGDDPWSRSAESKISRMTTFSQSQGTSKRKDNPWSI